jgi:hypothetical protein
VPIIKQAAGMITDPGGTTSHAAIVSRECGKGVGLARMAFIADNIIKSHPMALDCPKPVEDRLARQQTHKLTRGYRETIDYYFLDRLARGGAKIAAPVRTSSSHAPPAEARKEISPASQA